jgi:hypothetical protein
MCMMSFFEWCQRLIWQKCMVYLYDIKIVWWYVVDDWIQYVLVDSCLVIISNIWGVPC